MVKYNKVLFTLLTCTVILSTPHAWCMDEALQVIPHTHTKVTESPADYDKEYIENSLLPVIRQIVDVPMYRNYEIFMDNRNKAGFTENMTVPAYRALVLQTHANTLNHLGVTIPEYNLQYFDKKYIEDYLLPAIQKIMPHTTLYQNYDTFMDNRNIAGFTENMTVPAYRALVLQTHANTLNHLGVTIPEYNPYSTIQVKLPNDDRTIASQQWNDELKPAVQQIGSSIAKNSKKIAKAVAESKEVKGAVQGVKNLNHKRKNWI